MRVDIPRLTGLILALFFTNATAANESLTTEQNLGRWLFQDKNLSVNRNQSCESCHHLNPAKVATIPVSISAVGFVDINNVKTGTAISLLSTEEKALVAFMKTLTEDYPQWGNYPRGPPGTPTPSAFTIKDPKFYICIKNANKPVTLTLQIHYHGSAALILTSIAFDFDKMA